MDNNYKYAIAGMAFIAATSGCSTLPSATSLQTQDLSYVEIYEAAIKKATAHPLQDLMDKAQLTHQESKSLQNNMIETAQHDEEHTLLTQELLPPKYADFFYYLEQTNNIMNEYYGLDMNIPPIFISNAPGYAGTMGYNSKMDSFIVGEDLVNSRSDIEITDLLSHETQHRASRFLGHKKARDMALDYFYENNIRPVCSITKSKYILSIDEEKIFRMENGIEEELTKTFNFSQECTNAAKEYLQMHSSLRQNEEINADVGAVIAGDEAGLIYFLESLQEQYKAAGVEVPQEIRQYMNHPEEQFRIDLLIKQREELLGNQGFDGDINYPQFITSNTDMEEVYIIARKGSLTQVESQILQDTFVTESAYNNKYILLTEQDLPPQSKGLFAALEETNRAMNEHYGLDMNVPPIFMDNTGVYGANNAAYMLYGDSLLLGEGALNNKFSDVVASIEHELGHRAERFLNHRQAYDLAIDYAFKTKVAGKCDVMDARTVKRIGDQDIYNMHGGVEKALQENYYFSQKCAKATEEYLYIKGSMRQNAEINADHNARIFGHEHGQAQSLLEEIKVMASKGVMISSETRQYMSHPNEQFRVNLLQGEDRRGTRYVDNLNESRANPNLKTDKAK